jgi:hypothetical protein
VDLEQRSNVLFGRYQALSMYVSVARLTKSEFTTGQLSRLTGYSGSQCSKELARLASLGLIRTTSRRGDYDRIVSPFWDAMIELSDEWVAGTETTDPVTDPAGSR